MKPSVLTPGRHVTVRTGPATSECGGAPSTVTWGYPTNLDSEGLTQVKHCKVRATKCVYDVFLTSQSWADTWFQLGVTGSSPDGGWGSTAPYYVDSKGYFAITGTVFDKLRNGVPHVTVRLAGRGMHRTFRSLKSDTIPGFYSFAVKKKGTYTLTVRRHGKTAKTTVHVRHRWSSTELEF